MIPCRETTRWDARILWVSLRSTPRLNLDFSLREKSFVSFQFSVVRFQSSARSRRGKWKLNVTNLKILPGMGKIELSAGSPGWGTRGKHKLGRYIFILTALPATVTI